jgi:hypothetical protein
LSGSQIKPPALPEVHDSLQAATAPKYSFIADPKVGIVDLELMPFSLFPSFGDHSCTVDASVTYQSKVSDGTIVVKRLRQNLLQIEEPEGMGQQLIEVARADFSGDGIEDILLLNTVMRLTAHSVSAAFGS